MRQIQILQSGAISAGLLAVFVMSVLAEHIVAPGLAPADHMVSEYANAPGGWLITVGFTAWCCSLLLVAWIYVAGSDWLQPGPWSRRPGSA